jgi:2'-5' RNA ligase
MATRRPRRKFGPSQKDRIFFACLPDAETAPRIHAQAQALKEAHGLSGNPILPEHLHVTLFHLGDWSALPQEIVDTARRAAAEVRAAPFEVVFDRVLSFRNSTGIYPFVLTGDIAPWRPLYEALGAALAHAGLGAATRGQFTPHVTLTYDRIRVPPEAIAPISWKVGDFVLVHSLLGKTTHIHLDRWVLPALREPT